VIHRKLAFGGDVGRDDKLDGFLTRMGRGSTPEDDRAALVAFIEGDVRSATRDFRSGSRPGWSSPWAACCSSSCSSLSSRSARRRCPSQVRYERTELPVLRPTTSGYFVFSASIVIDANRPRGGFSASLVAGSVVASSRLELSSVH
jgi:hypothetical protein